MSDNAKALLQGIALGALVFGSLLIFTHYRDSHRAPQTNYPARCDAGSVFIPCAHRARGL